MSLDGTMFDALNHAGCDPALDLLMVGASFLGLTYISILAGPLLWHWKRRELAFDAVTLVLMTSLAAYVLKLLFMRERPFEALADANTIAWPFALATGPAMPSGHTARAFALAALLSLAGGRSWRLPAIVLAALVGLSRIYLGVHWPSDVLVGALLGVTLAAGMHWAGKGDNAYTRARNGAIARLKGSSEA